MDDYLPKPISPKALLEKIEKWTRVAQPATQRRVRAFDCSAVSLEPARGRHPQVGKLISHEWSLDIAAMCLT